HAFSNSPVCSAARSTLISGCYGPRAATHYHRKLKQVPMPEGLHMFPFYLRQVGYYATNNAKEDYNIIKPEGVWDESSRKASWRNRQDGQPFFHVFNIGTTHESRMHFTEAEMTAGARTNPDSCFVLPNHPQTELFKYSNARYRDKIVEMDGQVGEVVDELKKDGLLENTFIFYYGDHGGVLPGSKGYLNEVGVHVPLVVYIPPKFKHLVDFKAGGQVEGFVSFVDFGVTVLNLAGIQIPDGMDGKPFLGNGITAKEVQSRDETYSYADRFDEKYDMVRALRKGKYKYIRNYQPFNFNGLMNNYRYKQLGYQQWWEMYRRNELNSVQSAFFEAKMPEELYNLEVDPYETNNLAGQAKYAGVLKKMRKKLNDKAEELPDLSFYPEHYLVKNAFDNPVAFGQKHKSDIKKYLAITNLMLDKFENVKAKIESSLKSNDPWQRYWGLVVCSTFGKKANEFIPLIEHIAENDSEQINRVRAAEFFGLTGLRSPVETMTKALYQTEDGGEALLILNSIVLMKDGANKYAFKIQPEKIQQSVLENEQVPRRLDYLVQN
ncbi:MAG: sulfatase, partial [Calditrichaeota bacterium]